MPDDLSWELVTSVGDRLHPLPYPALSQPVHLRVTVHLYFELVQALWDAEARTVTIVYRRERGEDVRLAAEIIRLNSEGLGVHGTALHGAILEQP